MKKIVLLSVFALALSVGMLFAEDRLPLGLFRLEPQILALPRAEELGLQEAAPATVLPPPLKAMGLPIQAGSSLSRSGVLFWTNSQRNANEVASLQSSAVLDAAAEAKLNDMFEHQYFAHVSPAGKGVADWVGQQDYAFITVGENLALGNYKDDQALVQAWMDSPGHRANILNPKFHEIGIAAGKGMYEGRQTWLAVQIFGLPLSTCPSVDSKLHAEIESKKTELDVSGKALDTQYAELKQEGSKNSPNYVQNVKEYNSSVEAYNAAAVQVKALIDQYNNQVRAQQTCLEKIDND